MNETRRRLRRQPTRTSRRRSPASAPTCGRLRDEIGKMIVGQEEIVEGVIMAVLGGGHALLEGVPGLGKTMLVRTLAECIDAHFSRIQFTPDLMPADILGTNMIVEDEPAAASTSSSSAGPSSPTSCWPTRSTAPPPRPSRRCSRPCRTARSRSPRRPTSSSSRSSCWPRRTRSRWRAPIRCPRPSSTASSSSSRSSFPDRASAAHHPRPHHHRRDSPTPQPGVSTSSASSR